MLRIENDYKKNFKNGLSHLHLFCRLEAHLIKLKVTLPPQTAGLRLPTSQTDFEILQNQIQETTLTRIWSRLARNIPNAPTLNNGQAIRAWLIDPNNEEAIGCALYLSGCLLTSVPDELSRLKRWISLYLNDNLLTTLPKQVAACKFLVVLDVSDNQLSRLPTLRKPLDCLTELRAQCNLLNDVSNFVGLMTPGLIRVFLSNNCLTQFPNLKLGSLYGGAVRNYSIVDVSNNKIKEIRPGFSTLNDGTDMAYVTDINVRDNPLERVAKEVMDAALVITVPEWKPHPPMDDGLSQIPLIRLFMDEGQLKSVHRS
jgi:hypothetical protein